jgi:peptidoglycan/LPS O-acetylase OafA/YrhL
MIHSYRGTSARLMLVVHRWLRIGCNSNGGAMHKLASLDALRGLAILFVIISHFGAGEFGRNASIVFGNAGVILFFSCPGF